MSIEREWVEQACSNDKWSQCPFLGSQVMTRATHSCFPVAFGNSQVTGSHIDQVGSARLHYGMALATHSFQAMPWEHYLSLTFEHFSAEKKHTYLIRYLMKTYPGQPPTLAQPPAQQWKICQKFKYVLAGWAIASNEDISQYCLGLKSSSNW